MTRSQLIDELSLRHKLSRQGSEAAIAAILDAITDTLADNGRVELRGFGAFSVRIRPMRHGRNPRSGQVVTVPEKRVPFFKAGKALRERVNHGPLQKKAKTAAQKAAPKVAGPA
ncbi:MAG: integration host factor subunit beta [Magnetococcales bacterium]|nr:integration host factor subunit beta [Magnetococcales bacterium]